MGIRRFLILALAGLDFAAAVAWGDDQPASSISWEDAGHLPSDRPPRPKPIEPDAPSVGPLRVEPRPDPAPPKPDPVRGPVVLVWEMTDVSGQRWRHPDRHQLEAWVAAHNAQLFRPPQYYSTCGPNGCPR